MDKDDFFARCLEREHNLALTSIQSMPIDFQAMLYTNEKLLENAKMRLLESAGSDHQREMISALDQVFTWHCTMLSNATFLHGAELMEKEITRIMWRMR